jgi:hypothetical protein
MDQRTNVRSCLIINCILLFITSGLVFLFHKDRDQYFNFGPHTNLIVLSIPINTWTKYFVLQMYLMIVEVTQVIIDDIAGPIFGFSIYNPDKKVIHDFTKTELMVYANLFWFVNSLRATFGIFLSLSQFDIAFLKIVYSQIASIYTTGLLLDEKEFRQQRGSSNTESLKEIFFGGTKVSIYEPLIKKNNRERIDEQPLVGYRRVHTNESSSDDEENNDLLPIELQEINVNH